MVFLGSIHSSLPILLSLNLVELLVGADFHSRGQSLEVEGREGAGLWWERWIQLSLDLGLKKHKRLLVNVKRGYKENKKTKMDRPGRHNNFGYKYAFLLFLKYN